MLFISNSINNYKQRETHSYWGILFSDCHCHLSGVTDEIIEKAKNMDFRLLLTSGIDLASCEQAVNLAEKFNIVKACIGIHPWYADEYNGRTLRTLKNLAKKTEVVAISEIGLDFIGRMNKNWVYQNNTIDKQIQIKTFRAQLNLANEINLPVLIHDRTSNQEILDLLETEGNLKSGAAIHGFSKDLSYARRCVDLGVYLSIGTRSIMSENPELINVIRRIPLEWMLTETDSNDPEGVLKVARVIAELTGISLEEVGNTTTKNLMKLLGCAR